MKKKITLAVCAAIVAAASICVRTVMRHTHVDELFESNVEALTTLEEDMAKKIWIVYRHEDSKDFNCTKGGSESCN